MTRLNTPYFTLAVREDGRWSPQFGDYDRAVVEQEIADMLDSAAWPGLKRRDTKIVRSDASRASVNAALAALNADATVGS
jgi:hypothetical protein